MKAFLDILSGTLVLPPAPRDEFGLRDQFGRVHCGSCGGSTKNPNRWRLCNVPGCTHPIACSSCLKRFAEVPPIPGAVSGQDGFIACRAHVAMVQRAIGGAVLVKCANGCDALQEIVVGSLGDRAAILAGNHTAKCFRCGVLENPRRFPSLHPEVAPPPQCDLSRARIAGALLAAAVGWSGQRGTIAREWARWRRDHARPLDPSITVKKHDTKKKRSEPRRSP